ncbi:NADPH-dependent 2,4-dienoyl-CoA reductase, sulfur reductase [Halobacillus dabanensis]|uniref:NADPH-dependent 2,4-dienoyl-CoA reductase, sulfur reductase n=1 Tax=Halobacillus dabanensis TaxID=240302 RepID=A0A1I3Z0V9_HALDA|nr:FAD-dependent oxidoreductase [Halobacillus dabanensis]SFK37723.1 NADPH-dependent 2,4-dienoyl-CoA reductase, sulfur reductase [Halobacillus dabanensis]
MNFVIIGGDAAGMSAAMQIVRNSEGHDITVLEQGEITSYGQCGLPYVLSGDVESTDDLIARKPETFRNKYGIDVRTKNMVTEVDCEQKLVYAKDSQGQVYELKYDRLLVASGAAPVMPPWKGSDLEGVYSLKTIPDIEEIINATTENVNHVTIIGGGYIGLEMAESFRQAGKQVRLIDRGPQLAKNFDEDMGELILEEAERNRVEVHLGESVEGFEGDGKVEKVITDQGKYETDLVLVAVGVTPNTSFMKGTGIYKGLNDAITVNAFMETSILDIYAAGDCAMQYHRIKKKDDYIPLGTHANKQGQIAGLNMVDKKRSFRGIVGTAILKFFNLTLARTGLSEREAEKERLPYNKITIDSTHAAGYYSKDDPMTLKMIYHEETRQILGAQIIGKQGTDKRIDVLATALFHEMTIDELEDLDLAYAPPYNSVWDPVQQAARKAD